MVSTCRLFGVEDICYCFSSVFLSILIVFPVFVS